MPQHFPRVGVTVAQFQGFMPSTLLRGLKLLGIDFVELNKSIMPEIDRVVDSLGSMITAYHLPLIGENGWDFSCLDYKNEIDNMIATLQRYREKLRLQHVVCHPAESDKKSDAPRSSLEFLFENLQKLNIPIHLENVPALHPDEFLKVYWQAERYLGAKLAGMCFDAPHYFIDGHDPVELFKSFRDIASSVHLSDCLEAEDVHLPFDCGGFLPVHEFLSALRDTGFCGFITLEIKPHSLKELDAYIDSYMTTLQYMNYKKYLKTKLRLFALRPLINKFAA